MAEAVEAGILTTGFVGPIPYGRRTVSTNWIGGGRGVGGARTLGV